MFVVDGVILREVHSDEFLDHEVKVSHRFRDVVLLLVGLPPVAVII